MIQNLSRATTYVTTYAISQTGSDPVPCSHATGFFLRAENALLLVTNWHVVTGLNPRDPSLARSVIPHFMKVTVVRSGGEYICELSLPLYGTRLEPLWEEHPDGAKVDVVIYPLPIALERYFQFIDIQSAEDDVRIAETVAKDVFILGYPFSRDEMKAAFGEDAPYYVPVWKRGTIATEPTLRLAHRVLLIDSLSRPGMSGSPVVIAQDDRMLKANDEANSEVIGRILSGESGAIRDLDFGALTDERVKHFRFLGVYSGVVGNTHLSEAALGLCWHADTLRELTANARRGVMPFHVPQHSASLAQFLAQFDNGGRLIIKNVGGEVCERVVIR